MVECTYTLISFLLDEVIAPARSLALSRETDKLRETSVLLSHFIFTWHILPLETTLLALMDRDDTSQAFNLLEYLLLDSPQVAQR